jgi:hypothetical protein
MEYTGARENEFTARGYRRRRMLPGVGGSVFQGTPVPVGARL